MNILIRQCSLLCSGEFLTNFYNVFIDEVTDFEVDAIVLKVEGKGFGFAHVGSSKGFKEINRHCSDPTVVMPPYR